MKFVGIATQKTLRVRTCEITPVALELAAAWLSRQRAIWEARLDRVDADVINPRAKAKQHDRCKRKK